MQNAIENSYDSENNLFLSDYRIVYKEIKNFIRCIAFEYFIWANSFSISHMRQAENIL